VSKKRVCLVTSVMGMVEWFLIDQFAKLSRIYRVELLAQTKESDFFSRRGIDAEVVDVPVERKIRPWRDLGSLVVLTRYFRRHSPVVVHSVGPKAGLLAMLSARLAGVPVRVHMFTGQVWSTRSGLSRYFLKMADRLIANLATHILVDSHSQRAFLIGENVVAADRARVLANGSIGGVDTARFRPDANLRAKVRDRLAIPEEALVFVFMARLTRDKGALVMAAGFAALSEAVDPDAYLIVIGPDEEDLIPEMRRICAPYLPRVRFEGKTSVPEEYLASADVVCLPSYREGFGTVLIDAAAAAVPAIASRIYGSEEAVLDGVTGLLHAPGDAEDLALKMTQLYRDPALRARLGNAARRRVESEFSEGLVTSAVLKFYAEVTAGH
jgi:glycosyltransferase involved in cell wall biosynthesis